MYSFFSWCTSSVWSSVTHFVLSSSWPRPVARGEHEDGGGMPFSSKKFRNFRQSGSMLENFSVSIYFVHFFQLRSSPDRGSEKNSIWKSCPICARVSIRALQYLLLRLTSWAGDILIGVHVCFTGRKEWKFFFTSPRWSEAQYSASASRWLPAGRCCRTTHLAYQQQSQEQSFCAICCFTECQMYSV